MATYCLCRATARASTSRLFQAPAQLGARMIGQKVAAVHVSRTTMREASTSAASGYTQRPVYHHKPSTPMQCRTMFVQTETTPNEDSLKFIPGQHLSTTGQTHEFLSSQDARSSPLASALFDIPGVKLVFFGPDFISVSKAEDSTWTLMKPEIYSVIIEHFSQGKPLFFEGRAEGEGPEDTRILDTDSDVVAMVKELLDTRVRPSIQEDGGDIEYKSFDEDTGIVRVSLKGSCRGCDSSTVTLKSGIERMLMHYVPEVKGVEQIVSAEEAVAADEFAKFEARLRGEGKTVTI